MEKLIFLAVVVIISALHNWWKKRQGEVPEQEEEEQPWPGAPRRRPSPAPGSTPPPARPKAPSWEEELRRLLEGETATPPPPVPPVVVSQAPPPLPPPPKVRPRPRPAAPAPFLARSAIPIPEEGREEESGLAVKMPSLEQSAQAYLRARTLDARVTDRLKQVSQDVQSHPKFSVQRQVSPAIRQGVALLRDRQSQRAAIIASIVLGPPKALEHSSAA